MLFPLHKEFSKKGIEKKESILGNPNGGVIF